jgi:hypothetical protein
MCYCFRYIPYTCFDCQSCEKETEEDGYCLYHAKAVKALDVACRSRTILKEVKNDS